MIIPPQGQGKVYLILAVEFASLLETSCLSAKDLGQIQPLMFSIPAELGWLFTRSFFSAETKRNRELSVGTKVLDF